MVNQKFMDPFGLGNSV